MSQNTTIIFLVSLPVKYIKLTGRCGIWNAILRRSRRTADVHTSPAKERENAASASYIIKKEADFQDVCFLLKWNDPTIVLLKGSLRL
jgi:hypothetical protein